MSLIDEAREIKDWINSDDPCNTGDLEPNIVEQMCNHILAKPKRSKKTAGVWQITEERKAAIRKSAELFEEDASELESEEYSGAYTARQKSLEIAAVLRAMLRETGQ